MHPYLAQPELKKYCDEKGIVLTAYTPTGRIPHRRLQRPYIDRVSGYNTVRSDPTIIELAEKYKTTPGQIIISWHVARGVAVVPKSSNEQRQKDNLNVRSPARPWFFSADVRLTSMRRFWTWIRKTSNASPPWIATSDSATTPTSTGRCVVGRTNSWAGKGRAVSMK